MKTLNVLKILTLAGLLIPIRPDLAASQSLQRLWVDLPNEEQLTAQAPREATLLSRYTLGDYVTSTYSFRRMTRDNVELTRNNWEILFEGRADFQADFFTVRMVVDDQSSIGIVDLNGCDDITESIASNLALRQVLRVGVDGRGTEAPVIPGACYLSMNQDSDGRIVSLFRVKSHAKSESVVIDQIRVINVQYSASFIQNEQARSLRSQTNPR